MNKQPSKSPVNAVAKLQEFEARVERFKTPLFAYLGRLGFDIGTAEDLAQETFLRAWKANAQFDERKAQYSTWLFRIARNVAIDAMRQRQKVVETANTDQVMDAPDTSVVSDSIHMEQLQRRLDLALARLSAEDQETLALSGVEQLTNEEAASIVGCTTATYRTRLSRARARLKNQWELLK